MIRVLFHLLVAIQFGYGCYYDQVHVRVPNAAFPSPPYGGKFKYLSHLNGILQTLYFTIAFLNDLFGNNEPTPSEKPLIRRIKDVMFSSLAFPVAMFVGITFWGIYAVDRELILPRSLEPYHPTWLNHIQHTNIILFILIDLITSFRMYPHKKVGFTILCTFMLSYIIWMQVVYLKTSMWVYSILSIINWPIRIMFYLICLGLVSSLYNVGERLNRYVWHKEVKQTVKSGKKKAK